MYGSDYLTVSRMCFKLETIIMFIFYTITNKVHDTISSNIRNRNK